MGGDSDRSETTLLLLRWNEGDGDALARLVPRVASELKRLARAYLRNKQAREGFWELRETVRLDPSNLDAKLEFAQLAILAGDPDEALAQSESVIAADPQRVMGYLMKGQALEALKRMDEALVAFEKGLEVGPDDPTALNVLSKVYDARGMNDKAEVICLLGDVFDSAATGRNIDAFADQRFPRAVPRRGQRCGGQD